MKSLHKAKPNSALEAWSPPELDADAAVNSQTNRKEQVLAIFQKEEESKASSKESSILRRDTAGKNLTAWQPGHLDENNASTRADNWSFIEVTDTPFDRSWKVQSPGVFTKETSQRDMFFSEKEIATALERARLQAEEIILSAQAEADDLLLQAQSEIDHQKNEGYLHGKNEARAEIETAAKAIQTMVTEIETWKAEFLSQGEQILLEMLKDMARKMFGEGAKLDAPALHANLNRIIGNAHGLGMLKIFLNPIDARQLDPFWSEQQMLILGEQVKIVPSNNILPGGCLIKGNMGTVDARVETQLDSILNTFDNPQATAE